MFGILVFLYFTLKFGNCHKLIVEPLGGANNSNDYFSYHFKAVDFIELYMSILKINSVIV